MLLVVEIVYWIWYVCDCSFVGGVFGWIIKLWYGLKLIGIISCKVIDVKVMFFYL